MYMQALLGPAILGLQMLFVQLTLDLHVGLHFPPEIKSLHTVNKNLDKSLILSCQLTTDIEVVVSIQSLTLVQIGDITLQLCGDW